MFTELDANNCCSIIAQDLSNSVVNSANKESILRIFCYNCYHSCHDKQGGFAGLAN